MKKTRPMSACVVEGLVCFLVGCAASSWIVGCCIRLVETWKGWNFDQALYIAIVIANLAFVCFFITIPITAEIIGIICRPLLHRSHLLFNYSTTDGYPEGFFICSNTGQELRVATDRRGKPLVRGYRDHYAVCIGFTYGDLADAAVCAHEIFHSVEYRVPHSYLLPDDVSCLITPKLVLRDILRAQKALEQVRTGKAFFVYYCRQQFPSKAKENKAIVIDRLDKHYYQTSA